MDLATRLRAALGTDAGDPYAGVDFGRAARLGAALWAVSVVAMAALLPFVPPTEAMGAAGWLVAAVVLAAGAAAAVRLRVLGERAGRGELLASGYALLGAILVVDVLAGGFDTPYHQLYYLAVAYVACVHPPRRILGYLAALAVAMGIGVVEAGASSSTVGEAALQFVLCVAFAGLAHVLMLGVRRQRLALRDEGREARELALVDDLTGLGNRRRLVADLEAWLATATDERPVALVLFDLDGFKAYNDMYGHPAGDSMLERIAISLREEIDGAGSAYRMGGDEFCVLAPIGPDGPESLVRRAAGALSQQGEGFSVTSSWGTVLLPQQAADAAEALRVADQRMYADKQSRRSSAGRQTTDVLLKVVSERNPDLGAHLGDVAELAMAVGRRCGVPDEQLAALAQAAALHDVGKAAIPDAILGKPGPLDETEWEFMRRHTLIGERILAVAPALTGAARLVRWSHERYDGRGYPDGLSGDAIPLGARIVAACDAFDAMTSTRPYRPAMSRTAALEELRRGAGTQFDPAVVAAVLEVVADGELVRA
jgi:diguanylate cyclase (GGDEF)-like protein